MAAVFPGRRGVPGEHSRRSRDSRSPARQPDDSRLPHEAMDFDGLRRVLTRIHAASCGWSRATRRSRRCSRTRFSTRSRTRFSTMRRSRNGGRRRCSRAGRRDPAAPAISARSTPDAIARVRDEARPDPRDADELHDALLTAGFLTEAGLAASIRLRVRELDTPRDARRLTRATVRRPRPRLLSRRRRTSCPSCGRCIRTRASMPPALARRLDARRAVVDARATRSSRSLRGRLAIAGPTTAAALAASLAIADAEADAALLALECRGRRAARPLHPVSRRRWNGAIDACSRASTATRSIACARRSSRSPRPISCASSSPGSTSIRRTS